MTSFGRFVSWLIAAILIIAGAILLLGNLGFLPTDPLVFILDLWPVILIILGIYLIWVRLRPTGRS